MASITVGQTLSNSARTSKNQYDLIVSLKLNSQNIQNNTSNVTVTLQLKSNYAYFQQYACSGSLSLTGASPGSYSAQYSFPSLYSTITLKTWTGNVTHNAEGSYTVTASRNHIQRRNIRRGHGSVSLSGVTLPRAIPRASVLGTIPAFTYDGNAGVGAAFSVPVTRYYSGFYDVLTISVGRYDNPHRERIYREYGDAPLRCSDYGVFQNDHGKLRKVYISADDLFVVLQIHRDRHEHKNRDRQHFVHWTRPRFHRFYIRGPEHGHDCADRRCVPDRSELFSCAGDRERCEQGDREQGRVHEEIPAQHRRGS